MLESVSLKWGHRRQKHFSFLLIPGLIFGTFVAGQQQSIAADTATGWADVRLLESTWRKSIPVKPVRGIPDKAQVLAAVIQQIVPYEYQYAFMLELTGKGTKLAASREFLETAPAGFAELYFQQGDRAALVTLFSRCFPKTIGNVPVEIWLAPQQFDLNSLSEKNTVKHNDVVGLPNGILVLCDAFDQSTDKEVRSRIAKALRNAFSAHVSSMGNDVVTSDVCREWFYRHHTEFNVYVGDWHPGAPGGPRNLQIFRPRTFAEKDLRKMP